MKRAAAEGGCLCGAVRCFYEGNAWALPLVPARGADLLPHLRNAAHLSARVVPERDRRHDREPRRSLRVPARGSHLDE